jgi:hypothetical protein
MNRIETFKRIAARFPETERKLTEFPSGAIMLDFTIGEVPYCAEYLPSYNAYGLSKTAGATPFWEGVEQSFTSAEQLEAKIVELMNSGKQ